MDKCFREFDEELPAPGSQLKSFTWLLNVSLFAAGVL